MRAKGLENFPILSTGDGQIPLRTSWVGTVSCIATVAGCCHSIPGSLPKCAARSRGRGQFSHSLLGAQMRERPGAQIR